MPYKLTQGWRYLLRELIPRALLSTLTFKYVLPAVPFSLFHFHGSLLQAALFGTAFTALIWFFASCVMGSVTMERLTEATKEAWWFVPANIAFILTIPAVALGLAALVAPTTLTVNGLAAMLAGSVILNAVCAITHDYGAN